MNTLNRIPLFTEVNQAESAAICGGIKADFDKEKQIVTLTLDDGKTIKYAYGNPVWGLFGNLGGLFSDPTFRYL